MGTTTVGPTTVAPTTTTAGPPPSTTTAAPACPDSDYCENTCAAVYSCDNFAGVDCGGVACTGTMQWTRSAGCVWPISQTAGSCSSGPITCAANAWGFTMTHGPTGDTCIYSKPATAASCPSGTYSKTGGTCSDCPAEVTLYV